MMYFMPLLSQSCVRLEKERRMEYGGEHTGGKTGEKARGNRSLEQQWASRHRSSRDDNALVSSELFLSSTPVFLAGSKYIECKQP